MQLFRGNQRPDIDAVVHAVADLQRSRECSDALDEFIMDGSLDKEPTSGTAHLARVEEDRVRGGGNSRVQVGIRENNVRGLPSKLQREPLHVSSRGPDDRLARFGRPGERHLVHAGVGHQRRAHWAQAGQHVQHAIGKPCFLNQSGKAQRCQTGLLGRLQNDGAACGNSWCELPDGRAQRPVPRGDRRDDTHRLLDGMRQDFASD